MKLSEAILLGSMIKPQNHGFGRKDSSCALESACDAVGLDHWSFTERYWEWLRGSVKCPIAGCTHPSFAKGYKNRSIYRDVVYHLNDHHRLSREAIAQWVAMVEPQEVDVISPTTHEVVAEQQVVR